MQSLMGSRRPLLALLLPLAFLCLGLDAQVERIALEPRHEEGDAYQLSLEVTTRYDVFSWGNDKAEAEDVVLGYGATVVVLAVDEHGRPVRERHERVQMTYRRPDGETGSLFRQGAAYEVVRDDRGRIRIFFDDGRIDRRAERVVEKLLASRFEYSLEPALLDPGRPVAVGDSWLLDPDLVRRVLRDRGVRAIEFEAPPTATLVRSEAGDGLAIHYQIPVAWLELTAMPVNVKAAETGGRLEGRVELGPGPERRPVGYASDLGFQMNGVIHKPSVARTRDWQLTSSKVTAQRTEPIGGSLPAALSRAD